jgi:NAD(P)-dependent dehydrogenase (short-subunit alcohol dehydrogenase family)
MPQKQGKKQKIRPEQKQTLQPGLEYKMTPLPEFDDPSYKGSGKLKDKVAIITGGDSGIGRAVAVAFAKEGAHVAILYLDEDKDAKFTQKLVEAKGSKCIILAGDVGSREFCAEAVKKTVKELKRIDILVNNAAIQFPKDDIEAITERQLERTFRTNIFSYFFMVQAALKHLEKTRGTVINSTSVTAYRGSHHLIDYSATKGAIVTFTRSLSHALLKKNIRVNGVAPGPIWTPLIPASVGSKQAAEFGSDAPMGRAGQPCEVAPSYVFLASSDSSYMTGQVLHPNGGEIING